MSQIIKLLPLLIPLIKKIISAIDDVEKTENDPQIDDIVKQEIVDKAKQKLEKEVEIIIDKKRQEINGLAEKIVNKENEFEEELSRLEKKLIRDQKEYEKTLANKKSP